MTHAPSEGRSLARRVSGWTSNLLATGIVLAAALGVGRQVTHWWRIDPQTGTEPTPLPSGPGDLGDQGEQPLELTFGGGYSMQRLEHRGDLAAALERLLSECREILERGAPPLQPPTSGEQRFLERMQSRAPLEENSGMWQIHQFDGKLPLLVGVRENRVLVWGLAMPADEQVCTLLLYQAGAAVNVSSPREFELPPGWRRTLTLRGQGETSMGVATSSLPRRASDELDRFLTPRGWKSTGWRPAGAAWHNRYWAAERSLSVQLMDDNRGGTLGIISLPDSRPLASDPS